MKTPNPISPFRLSSLFRSENDPIVAFNLFKNPNPDAKPSGKSFRYSPLSYDLIITKLGKARKFDEMEEVLQQLKRDTRVVPKEIIFCNAMKFYGQALLYKRALQLFDEMPEYRCQRTIKSLNSLLNALLMSKKFDEMKEVYLGMEKYARPDACTYNILINGCRISGSFDNAWNLFNEMHRKGLKPNVVTFGTLIHGLCMDSKIKEAFKLKADMSRLYGVPPNASTYTAMIKGLCRNGELSLALILKEEIVRNKIKLDSYVYSTLIGGLFRVGRREEAFRVFEEMALDGCKPDTVTYNVMINGHCMVNNFEEAYKVLENMAEKGCKRDVISYNTVIRGLCKEGRWSEAKDLFEDMPRQGCKPDVVSYRLLFDGLCGGSQLKEATLILDEMIFKGYVPHLASTHKLVAELCQKGNMKLLMMILNILGKRNAIDQDTWLMVISKVYQENKVSGSSELLATLVP